MSANFGWYEIMDRLSVIQNQIHDHVYEHQETDAGLQKQKLVVFIQQKLMLILIVCI